MCDLLEASGFQNVTTEPLTGVIVTIYTAEKARHPERQSRDPVATP